MHDFEGRIPGIQAIHSSTEPLTVPVYFNRPDGARVEIGYAVVVGEVATYYFKKDLRGLDDAIIGMIRGDLLKMSFRKVPIEAEHILLEVQEATALPVPPSKHINIDHLFKDKPIEEND